MHGRGQPLTDAAMVALQLEAVAHPKAAALGSTDLAYACPDAVVGALPAAAATGSTVDAHNFGTPHDITLDALSVERFYPADERTEALLRALHVALPPGTRAPGRQSRDCGPSITKGDVWQLPVPRARIGLATGCRIGLQ